MLRRSVAPSRSLACVAVVCALACRRSPVPAPPAAMERVADPAAATSTRQATLENGFLTVDVRVPASPSGPKPAVIALAGDHEALLAAGAVVVTYRINWDVLKPLAPPAPPPAHNTVGVWLLAAPTAKTVGEGWFGVIAASAGRVPRVVDWLATQADVDPHRIGMMGTSTTGFVTLEAVAREPRIAAAAAIAACGDYPAFLHRSSLAMNGAALDLDDGYRRQLVGRHAIAHPERLTHAALLMLNGTADAAVPIDCAQKTARVLAAAYERAGVPERFRFVSVAGAGHNDLAARARREIGDWFAHWLGLQPVAATS